MSWPFPRVKSYVLRSYPSEASHKSENKSVIFYFLNNCSFLPFGIVKYQAIPEHIC